MNFKKRVNGSWTDTPHYIHNTSTDTITTLPAVIHPTGTTATVGLKGNTVQNGTPTPDNPVPVVGVGDLDNGQYKIPISSNSTTTPVYLGEVETTRKIKKYEFTGQETGWNYSANGGRTRAYIALSDSLSASLCICSHYDYVNSSIFYPDIDKFTLNSSGIILIGLDGTIYTDVTAFKTYLAQQYANGTPVTVWYVLANETTGIVNEPLMKIGEYADTLSNVSIPVTAGEDTLSVGTTVQPSEVTVNYKGWHPVTNVHERSGGAWD